MARVEIIGGGLAGLVAAVTVAEGGGEATLIEANAQLGGRACTQAGAYRSNFGPHALYLGGEMETWLRQRDLLPALTHPKTGAVKLVWQGRLRRLPLMLLPMLRSLRHEAPVGIDYRTFARRYMSESAAEAAIGFASLPTFHGDPGGLSAAFVQERLQRSMARPAVGYIAGGWQTLVALLAERARSLGVEFRLAEKLPAIAAVQRAGVKTIVATDLAAARKLLDDPSVVWEGSRTAVFDVALARQRKDPRAVLDLDRKVYVSDYAAYDAALAPRGESLVQCVTGLNAGEGLREGLVRIHAVLDLAFGAWRARVRYEHKGLMDGGTGAVDLPGTSWQDRPAIERGDGVFLAGDGVAAPGVLSEVSLVSGIRAGQGALRGV